MRVYLYILCLISFQSAISQTAKDSFYHKKIKELGVKFIPVYNGKYKVFTQKVGSGKTKLLLLHGGPLNTHEYFENFPEHLSKADVEIYYYDQLGSYYSDQPNDTSIWRIERFVEEVEEVRQGLGLKEFFILGHSWGAMLGQLYAAKYPAHLKGLIISNVPAEIRDTAARSSYVAGWRDDIHNIVAGLPEFKNIASSVLDTLRFGSPIADTALKRKYDRKRDSVIFRENSYRLSDIRPEPMQRNLAHIDRRLRDQSGMLQKIFYPNYVAADSQIVCPVLMIGGAYDRWLPKAYPAMKTQFTKTKVRLYLCPNSGHFSMWDDTENYFREVIRFIAEVRNNKFDPDK